MQFIRVSLLATLMFTICGPAFAQGYHVDKDKLAKPGFFKYRPILEVTDESPIVNYNMHGNNSAPLVIPTISRPASVVAGPPPGAIQVGDGIYMVQGAPSSMGYPMVPNRPLAPAGMQSNIPARPITAGSNLPNGYTTGLHGALKPWPPTSPAVAQRAAARRTSPIGGTAQPVTAIYNGPNMSVGGSSSLSTKTSTTAKLLMKDKHN